LNYIDPATESIADGETQIWKITHNGVDTHPVHFHLVNVQVINRVGWDGTIKPPLENELGWKETVRMHPLEDVIVAVRSVRPKTPFGLPQSIRPLDPTQPLGSTLGFTQINPTNNTPLVVANEVTNYNNEYVWHCHILGHEENDFMRPIVFKPTVVVPDAPSNLALAAGGGSLTWVDPTPALFISTVGNAQNEIGFTVLRSSNGGAFTVNGKAIANATSWTDATWTAAGNYSYKIVAYNAAGNSLTSNTVSPPVVVWAPTGLTATPNNAGTSVRLQWTDNANNETAYTVNVSVNGGAYSLLTTMPRSLALGTATGGTVSYNAVTVPGNIYSYQVSAIKVTASVTTTSAPAMVVADLSPPPAPATPTALAARIATATSVVVTWIDNASNETAYVVEASVNGGAFATLATINRNATLSAATGGTVTYNATVAVGNIYSYQVHAITTKFGSTTPSTNAGPVTINVSVPLAPANVAAAAGAVAGSIVVTWLDNSSNESGFTVQRSLLNAAGTAFGAWINVGTVAANVATITDTGRITGRTYRYQVRANSAAGNSAYVGPSNSVVAP
jgi:hypothetical protein